MLSVSSTATSRLGDLTPLFRAHVEARLTLLQHLARISGVSTCLMGDVGAAAASFVSLPNCQVIPGEAVSFWRDHDVIERLGMVHEARGENRQAADCYRKVIAFIHEHADDYDPAFADVFVKLVNRLDQPTET
jgi:hypothetical protein